MVSILTPEDTYYCLTPIPCRGYREIAAGCRMFLTLWTSFRYLNGIPLLSSRTYMQPAPQVSRTFAATPSSTSLPTYLVPAKGIDAWYNCDSSCVFYSSTCNIYSCTINTTTTLPEANIWQNITLSRCLFDGYFSLDFEGRYIVLQGIL